METRGLLFIPDISGFTRFVNETDILHSQLIIKELLEILINSNQMGLEVSEVEGDAILFYKFCEPPALEELFSQVEKMFCTFHKNLLAYDLRKYCQCAACLSAVNLTLKVITHYGEFSQYNVKDFRKLIGKDVIVAHQLLKNDIGRNEYWLATQNLLQQGTRPITDWMKWEESSKKTESGEIRFQYTLLTDLKTQIDPEIPDAINWQEMKKVISVSHDYETDIIRLFHATGDFNYRAQWMVGINSVEEIGHFLPRVGMRCRYKTSKRDTIITSSSYKFNPKRIEFSETEEVSGHTTSFILEDIGNGKARCTLHYYIKGSVVLFNLFKKHSIEHRLKKSLKNIEAFLPQIKMPGVT